MSTDLKDATEKGDPAAYPKDAGQFAARWNALPPEAREEWYAQIVANAEASTRKLERRLETVELSVEALAYLGELLEFGEDDVPSSAGTYNEARDALFPYRLAGGRPC